MYIRAKQQKEQQTQIHTEGAQQRAQQQRDPAEPPNLHLADDRRRSREQTSNQLEEGRPSTLKMTARATRRKLRDLDFERARPSRPHVQHRHHLPPERPSRATTIFAPSIPALEPSTTPLRTRALPPRTSSPRLHGRPEKIRRTRAPEPPLASVPPLQLHPSPPRPARGARGARQHQLLHHYPQSSTERTEQASPPRRRSQGTKRPGAGPHLRHDDHA